MATGYFSYVNLKQGGIRDKMIDLSTENDLKAISPAGVYEFVRPGSDNFSAGILKIENIKLDSFDFNIQVIKNGVTEFIQGTAAVKDNIGFYIDKKTNSNGKGPCELTFKFNGHDVFVEDNHCYRNVDEYGHYFTNAYLRDGKIEQLSIERFFENKKDFELLKKLVGSNIVLFEHTSEFELYDEPAELNTNLKMFKANTTGYLFGSIVMISPDGKIFAAVIDPDKDIILYFTNVPEYKNKLPASIEDWRSEFKDKNVKYKFVGI